MGFIGFRWGFFFRIFPANAEVDFFFSVGFMVDFRGHTGRWHSQWSLGWWTTKHWISQLFMVWAGIPAVVFFFGGGQLSYDLATLKQMVHSRVRTAPWWFPGSVLGKKWNKLSVSGGISLSWVSKSWGFAGLHLEFYDVCCTLRHDKTCIYICAYIKCSWSVPW